MDELHVVLGASGGSGGAVVRELVKRGKRVRAVSRSGRGDFPSSVEGMRGDVADPERAKEACAGAAVVYNCVNVPYPEWPKTLPKTVEGSLAGAAEAGAKLVFTDNLYMYGEPSGPMTEQTPRRAQGKKGKLRIQLEEMLMDAHRSGRVRVAIGRASDFYGSNANSVTRDFKAVVQGKRASWPGSLDQPRSMTYLEDFAWGLATLGERDEALGEIWHLPSNEPITGRAFIELVGDVAGKKVGMSPIGRGMVTLGGLFSPTIREVKEVMYQFEQPFVMDFSKFERAFGAQVTPYREAIARTLEWYRQQAA